MAGHLVQGGVSEKANKVNFLSQKLLRSEEKKNYKEKERPHPLTARNEKFNRRGSTWVSYHQLLG